jgi:hypothetical protein
MASGLPPKRTKRSDKSGQRSDVGEAIRQLIVDTVNDKVATKMATKAARP